MITLSRRALLTALGLSALAIPLQGCVRGGDPKAPGADPSGLIAHLDRRPGALLPAASAHLGVLGGRLGSLLVKPGENFALSPLSIASALAMTRNGARGETASRMDAVLGITDLDAHNQAMNALDQYLESLAGPVEFGDRKGDIALAQANRIWLQTGLAVEQPFLDALATDYGAGVQIDDFEKAFEAARARINAWVSEQTRTRIAKLLPEGSLDALTRMVLVNALYFKAPWREALIEVGNQPFTTGSGTRTEVHMLATGTSTWFEDATGEATSVPYLGDTLAMTLVKPKSSVATVFSAWEKGGVATMLASMEASQVNLTLPAWEQRSTLTLREALSTLGMEVAFTGDADFSGMTTAQRLAISDVHHQVFVAVDKEGTEAAAATGVVMSETSAPVEMHTLTLDRPFCWVIHDLKTRTPLFVGAVADPLAGA
ncbi:MAG TPA: serpin family protein [Propionibacteriaceae bacterium]|nr:serpin family protein [Propionibacteriaceae bacterium]